MIKRRVETSLKKLLFSNSKGFFGFVGFFPNLQLVKKYSSN